MKHLAKILRVLVTGTAFLSFWWGGLFLSWLVLPVVRWRHRHTPELQAVRCRETIAQAFRLHVAYMRLCRLVSFDPAELRARLPDGPFVLVANHPSLIDIVLLLSTHPSACCVVKGSLFRSPFVGRLLQMCGHIDAGGGTALEGMGVINQAVERLKAGHPVVVFPEGTRSPVRSLGRFKQGAFHMARAAGVPVVPVHIRVEPPGLMRGIPWYTVPDGTMHYTMTVLRSFDAPEEGDVRRLATEVRGLIEKCVVAHHSSVVEAEAMEPALEPAG